MPGGDYRDALRERAGWQPEAGPARRRGRRASSASTAAPPATRSASGRGSASRSASRATCSRIDPLTEHDPARPARGPRDADAWRSSASRSSPVEPPAARGATSGERSGSATARPRCTVNAGLGHRSPSAAARWVATTDKPVWAAAPGQAAVLYDGDVVLGGGRIERDGAAAAAGPRSTRRGGSHRWPCRRRTPAARPRPWDPPRSRSCRHLPCGAVRADPRQRRRPGATARARRRSSGRGQATRSARASGST